MAENQSGEKLPKTVGLFTLGCAGYVYENGEWNRPYQPQPGDVLINGKMNGRGEVIYGIESFFVPEGEGIQLENEAEFAYLRVGEQGDALLQSIE